MKQLTETTYISSKTYTQIPASLRGRIEALGVKIKGRYVTNVIGDLKGFHNEIDLARKLLAVRY